MSVSGRSIDLCTSPAFCFLFPGAQHPPAGPPHPPICLHPRAASHSIARALFVHSNGAPPAHLIPRVLKPAPDAQGLISKICKAQVPALPDMYSDDWKNVVRLCLSKNPADRPTAQQLLDLPFVKPVVEAVDNKLGPPLVPGSRETVVIDTGEVMEILERCTSKQTGGVAMKQKREAGEVPPKGHPTEGVAPRPQSSGSQREEAAPEGVKGGPENPQSLILQRDVPVQHPSP